MAEVRHDAIGDIVEVIVDVDDAREWGDAPAFDKGVGHRVAGREAARHRHEIAGNEFAASLCLDQPHDVRNGDTARRIMRHVATAWNAGWKVIPLIAGWSIANST